jgi:F0F1-type ATP synthase membrane subunit b/b'
MPQTFPRSSSRLCAHLCALSLVWCLASSEAFASGGEGHHPTVWDIRSLWLNFALYVVLLYVLLKKVVGSGWATRRQRIEKSVVSATSEVESADKALRSIEEVVKNLKAEQERAREEVLSLAKEEAASILRAAEDRAQRIRTQATDLLKGETRSAEASFRSALVARAVELAKSKFSSGQFSSRQDAYVAAAVDRAKRLVQ